MKTSLTLDRTLQVLNLLGEGPLRASEAATALGFNRTVTHRLLSTLQQQRLVIQVDGRYHLGDGIRPLAQHVETRLRGAATDPAGQLTGLTGGTVLVTLRSGLLTSVLTFMNADRREEVHLVPEIGTAYSLAASPHGLAMLAFSEPATIARARRQAADPERYDRMIAETRSRGWTLDSIDPPPHPLGELAAPLFTVTEYADAALALIPPEGASAEEFVEPLLRACEVVSRAMRDGQS